MSAKVAVGTSAVGSEADIPCRLDVRQVQSAFYRAWLEAMAVALGVVGWVRNRRDGSVEAVLQGPPAKVADMLRRFEKAAQAARIKLVEVPAEEGDVHNSFEARPSL